MPAVTRSRHSGAFPPDEEMDPPTGPGQHTPASGAPPANTFHSGVGRQPALEPGSASLVDPLDLQESQGDDDPVDVTCDAPGAVAPSSSGSAAPVSGPAAHEVTDLVQGRQV